MNSETLTVFILEIDWRWLTSRPVLLFIIRGRSNPRNCSATSRKCTRHPVSSGWNRWALWSAVHVRRGNSSTVACWNPGFSVYVNGATYFVCRIAEV